jgi:hypothetical protein
MTRPLFRHEIEHLSRDTEIAWLEIAFLAPQVI